MAEVGRLGAGGAECLSSMAGPDRWFEGDRWSEEDRGKPRSKERPWERPRATEERGRAMRHLINEDWAVGAVGV